MKDDESNSSGSAGDIDSSSADSNKVEEARIDCVPEVGVQCCKPSAEKGKERNMFLTPQYFMWNFLVGFGYLYFFYLCYKRSNEWAGRLKYTLRPGIIPGRKVDATDPQWRQLRELFPPLFVLASVWVLLSNVVRTVFGAKSAARRVFYVVSIIGVLYGLHSRALVFPVMVAAVHYGIAKAFRTYRFGIFVAWAWNIGITLYMYDTSGFSRVLYLRWFFGGGQMLRWHTIFKISLLRMISFHMDYYWTLKKRPPNQRVSVKVTTIHSVCYLLYCVYLLYVFLRRTLNWRGSRRRTDPLRTILS